MASGAPQTMQLHKNTSDLLSISGEARQLGKSGFADIASVFLFYRREWGWVSYLHLVYT